MTDPKIDQIKMELWRTFQEGAARTPVADDGKEELATIFRLTVEHAMKRDPQYWEKGRQRVINATNEIAEWAVEASRHSVIRREHARWAACKVITKYHQICEQFIARFGQSLTAAELRILSDGCTLFLELYADHCGDLEQSKTRSRAGAVRGSGKSAGARKATSRKGKVAKKK
jgi:hypothetical protein